jgi:hypothetical protein
MSAEVMASTATLAKLRQSASRLAAATADVNRASKAAWTHDRASTAKRDELAELEHALEQHRTAVLLGDVEDVDGPDPAQIERLRADMAVNAPVAAELRRRLAAAEATHHEAKREHFAAKRAFLREVGLNPARARVQEALDVLANALADLMGAHQLAVWEYSDPDSNSYPIDYHDCFGPAAYMIAGMQSSMAAHPHPYDLRPSWLSLNTQFQPDEWARVKHAQAVLTNRMERELAA